MAVQQNKPTHTRRGMRRSLDPPTTVTSLSADQTTGVTQRRHHTTAHG